MHFSPYKEPPVIIIASPDQSHSVKVSSVTVAGTAENKSGIVNVFMNNSEAELDEKGRFRAEVLLKIGRNEINVTAVDIEKNQSVKQIVINREKSIIAKGKVPISTETKEKNAPKIRIISPDSTRSVSIISFRQTSITITGFVESKVGLLEVLVNCQMA